MNPALKNVVRAYLRKAGYEIHRIKPGLIPLALALDHFGIDTVFDVGANAGQFGLLLRASGYRGRLVSFEPLSKPHATLCERASNDPAWQVHPRVALGDEDGEITINISANSLSSSALPGLGLLNSTLPSTAYVDTEVAPVRRFDSIAAPYLADSKRPFLKLDAQGYEGRILDGCQESLPRVHGVICEMALAPLYEGQALWLELIGRLESAGFSLWALETGFNDPRVGRTLELDATFFRT